MEALQQGEIAFEEVVGTAYKPTLQAMAEIAGVKYQGLRDQLVADLLKWFAENVEVTESEDDDDGGTGRNFTSPRYEEAFWSALAFQPDEASRKPREYQLQAVERLLKVLRSNAAPQELHVATGGGKTWIANDVVRTFLQRRGGQVVWLTKDWELLRQAAQDLSRRHDMAGKVSRLGGDRGPLGPLPEGLDGKVIYSTLQTFIGRVSGRRLNHFPAPSLVVWDECHWGENAKLGERLFKWCRDREVPLLGLTATPRAPEVSDFRIAFSLSFDELIRQGHLARPVPIEPVITGYPWHPDKEYRFGDQLVTSQKFFSGAE